MPMIAVLMLLVFSFVMLCVAAWLAPDPKPFTRFACIGLASYVLAEIVTRVMPH